MGGLAGEYSVCGMRRRMFFDSRGGYVERDIFPW